MIYGTVVPVIAGFLLTAVPNWTQTKPITGRPLAALVALWLAGRLALVAAGAVDATLVAGIDVGFLPVLAYVLGVPILRSRKPRNFPVIGVLALLAAANAAIHYGTIHFDPVAQRAGMYGAVYLVVMLMLIISGRIVPLFTRNFLKRHGIAAAVKVETNRTVGAVGITVATIAMLLDLVAPNHRAGAWMALGAAALLLARMSTWQSRSIAREPMLWILHLGHAWIAVGFACRGASLLWGGFFGAAALHAFTAGAMGTLILGVMCRVALGHSGREVEASRGTRWIFALVTIGAAFRVVGASASATLYAPSLLIGGGSWTSAWLLFTLLYWKILTGPRVDAD
jgi:uncharacterized protein involved in response to NO